MNAPLAEQTSNVIQFELTTGCSYNGCTYCSLFKRSKFQEKSPRDFKQHVDGIFTALKERKETQGLERIFIGGGDALSVDTSSLHESISYAITKFRDATSRLPKRVAVYGSVPNILTKSYSDLEYLFCGGSCLLGCSQNKFGTRIGLELIYLGLETGDDQLLQEIAKGYNANQMYDAIRRIRRVTAGGTKLKVSSFIMPGLGGEKHSHNHVRNTLQALRELKPEFINLMSIKEHPGSRYAKKMDVDEQKGENRRLTAKEAALQTADFIAGLDFPTTIGCFDNSTYLGEDTNLVHFPSFKLDGNGTEKILADVLRETVQNGQTSLDQRMIEERMHAPKRRSLFGYF